MIRLLLVDNHIVFRQSLASMLAQEPDFTVVAQAGSVAEARDRLAKIDVALVDLDLPDGSGVKVIQVLQAVNRAGRALVWTGSASLEELEQAVEAGAGGLMHKSAPLKEIVAATRRLGALGAGELLLARREMVQKLRRAREARLGRAREAQWMVGQLTPEEREVLLALAEGLSNEEIGQRLHISVATVRNHMARIPSKLEVESRLQAVLIAMRLGEETMTIDAALVKEQGVEFAVVSVKRHILDSPTQRNQAIQDFQPCFPGFNIVLMGQDSRGRATYVGRPDIVRFLSNVAPGQLPWKRYTFRATYVDRTTPGDALSIPRDGSPQQNP